MSTTGLDAGQGAAPTPATAVLHLVAVDAEGVDAGGLRWPLAVDATLDARAVGVTCLRLPPHDTERAIADPSTAWLAVEVIEAADDDGMGGVPFSRATVRAWGTLAAALPPVAASLRRQSDPLPLASRIALRQMDEVVAAGGLSAVASSGVASWIALTADLSKAATCGRDAMVASDAGGVRVASCGARARIELDGRATHAAIAGTETLVVAGGDSATIAASGEDGRIVSSGARATLAVAGERAQVDTEGAQTVVAIASPGARFRLGPGAAFAVRYDDEHGVARFATGVAGHEGVKAHAWYRVDRDGILREV